MWISDIKLLQLRKEMFQHKVIELVTISSTFVY
ncbi:MAG: hypothetical protein ETSY2_51745 [Candidatus Entotheonella gemina]|uniref:Uncharacterized protein n=1 Tax=Candidatus Entotheonella gemina TaxID=1429439 RepID=W4L6D9_9BACT|nr:MAG: hypothetical protein ETSY2_51745 [Candidatus Entotheonella gemina]